MAGKITDYSTFVTTLHDNDLVDWSVKISSSPDVYDSQKMLWSDMKAQFGGLPLALPDGKVFIGQLSGSAAAKSIVGDVTIDRDGNAVIGTGKVTNAMLNGPISLAKGGTGADLSGDTNGTIYYKAPGGFFGGITPPSDNGKYILIANANTYSWGKPDINQYTSGTLDPSHGGTGVNNQNYNITLGASLTTTSFGGGGLSPIILRTLGYTDVTLPLSGTLLANPMTTAGDIIYENSTPTPARLPIGNNSDLLQVTNVGGVLLPRWVSASSLIGNFITVDGKTKLTSDWDAGDNAITAGTVIINNGTTALNINTDYNGVRVNATDAGSVAYYASTTGIGIEIDAGEMGVRSSSRGQAGAFFQDGELSANNFYNVVSIQRNVIKGSFDATRAVFSVADNSGCSPDLAEFVISGTKKVSINNLGRLVLAAGQSTSASLQFTSATNLATGAAIQAGNMEFQTDKWYGTLTTGTAVKEFAMNDVTLTPGWVIYAGTNGRLTGSNNIFFDGNNLGITTTTPASKIEILTAGLGNTQTSSGGITRTNNTAATVSLNQISAANIVQARGWASTPAASQIVAVRDYLFTVTGTNNPIGGYTWEGQVNGAGYSTLVTFATNGNVALGNASKLTDARLFIESSSSLTGVTSPGSTQQIAFRNTDTTDGNLFAINWLSSAKAFGNIAGIYRVHSSGVEYFDIAFTGLKNGVMAEAMRIQNGSLLIGVTTQVALLTIAAGGTAAGTGQINLANSSGVLSTPVSGSAQFYNNLYFTNSSGIRVAFAGSTGEVFSSTGSVGTTPTDIFSKTIVANYFLTNGDEIAAEYYITLATATKLKSIQIYLTGAQIFTGGGFSISNATGSMKITVRIIRDSSTSIRYVISVWSSEGTANDIQVGTATGLTLTSSNVLRVSAACGTGSSNGDITGFACKYISNPVTL